MQVCPQFHNFPHTRRLAARSISTLLSTILKLESEEMSTIFTDTRVFSTQFKRTRRKVLSGGLVDYTANANGSSEENMVPLFLKELGNHRGTSL